MILTNLPNGPMDSESLVVSSRSNDELGNYSLAEGTTDTLREHARSGYSLLSDGLRHCLDEVVVVLGLFRVNKDRLTSLSCLGGLMGLREREGGKEEKGEDTT